MVLKSEISNLKFPIGGWVSHPKRHGARAVCKPRVTRHPARWHDSVNFRTVACVARLCFGRVEPLAQLQDGYYKFHQIRPPEYTPENETCAARRDFGVHAFATQPLRPDAA